MCLAAGSAQQLSGPLTASVVSPELGFLPAKHSSGLGAHFVRTLSRIWADRLAGWCSKALLALHFGWEQLSLGGVGFLAWRKLSPGLQGGLVAAGLLWL